MTNYVEEALHWIQSNRASSINALIKLVRQPSISSTGEGVRECANLLCDMLTQVGLKAEVLPTAGLPAVYGERIEAGKPTVLFYGHYDVQPPGPVELWKTPPFEPVIANGRVYGRGTADNKGQFLAHIVAVDAFLRTVGSTPCSVKFLLDGEEESGSPSLPGLAQEKRALLACDLVYFADGPIHYSGRPQVFFGCRGVLDVEIEIHDNIRDCHSGHFGGIVSNPAWKMAHLLASMCGPDGEVLVDGFYDMVRPVTKSEEESLSQIPFDEKAYLEGVGVPEVGGRDPIAVLKRIMFRPTMTIAGLGSGDASAGMRTIVPYRAVSKIDMRLVADQDPDKVYDCIVRHVKTRVPEAKIRCLGKMYPSRTPVDLPVSAAVIRAVEKAWGTEPVVLPSTGASSPDYVFTKVLGVPSVMVPYANVDESNHGPNENISIDLFMKGIMTSVHVLEAMGSLREQHLLPRSNRLAKG